MVHNGIEYGIMAAYTEGLAILKKADIGLREHAKDAETAPLRNPEYYQYRSTCPTSPRSGAAAAWWAPGCST